MSKVNFVKLNLANVTAENKSDETRKYDISCNVNIAETRVQSVDRGKIIKDDVELATFNKWSEEQLNVNFNIADVKEMLDIVTALDEFYANIVDKVAGEPIKI